MTDFREYSFSNLNFEEERRRQGFRDLTAKDLTSANGENRNAAEGGHGPSVDVAAMETHFVERESRIAAAEQRVAELIQNLEEHVIQWKERESSRWRESKIASIRFSMALAEKLTKTQIRMDVSAIERIVERLLEERLPDERATLKLSTDDVEMLKKLKPDLFDPTRSDRALRVEPDASMQSGCAALDTDASRMEIDYRHQLRQLEDLLIENVEKPEVATGTEMWPANGTPEDK